MEMERLTKRGMKIRLKTVEIVEDGEEILGNMVHTERKDLSKTDVKR